MTVNRDMNKLYTDLALSISSNYSISYTDALLLIAQVLVLANKE